MHESTNVAPDTLMYMDVVTGRYSNFDTPRTTDGKSYLDRPWRFELEGILQVPSTPFFIGFNANIHQNFHTGSSLPSVGAKDDLRFLFGVKLDAGRLFDAVGKIR